MCIRDSLESGDGAGYKDIKDPEWRSGDGFTFEYLEKNGFIIYADTLEELAKKLDMDPATLQATVDEFNKSVESGSDEFGRTLYSTKLELSLIHIYLCLVFTAIIYVLH